MKQEEKIQALRERLEASAPWMALLRPAEKKQGGGECDQRGTCRTGPERR